MHKALVFSLLIITISNALTIGQIKKLQYKEQTPKNIELFKSSLENLVLRGNSEAMMMLGLAYETGSHWPKDMKKAYEYYLKAVEYNNPKASLKIGVYFYNKNQLEKAQKFLTQSLELKNYQSLKYLLDIALEQKNKEQAQKLFDIAKKNNIKIDALLYDEVETFIKDKSNAMKYIENKTFELTKDYIIGVLNSISSMQGAFDNLGYKVEDYIIHNGTEPLIEIVLEKLNNTPIDADMAILIAGDNLLKSSIVKSLIWANNMEPIMIKEANHKLKRVELEIGTSVTAKIVTTKE